MTYKDAWKSNDELRADLRIAVYECKRDFPEKTYSEIGKEFNVSAADANKLVIEYCKKFNLPEPPVVIVPGRKYVSKDAMLPGTRLEISGRKGTLINDLSNTLVVLFEDINDTAVVYKSDLTVVGG